MKESQIQAKLKAECKARGFLIKLSDRFTSGVPDYVWVVNGKTIFIETKATGEKLRPIQMWFRNQIQDNGGTHFTVNSIDDIRDLIQFSESK